MRAFDGAQLELAVKGTEDARGQVVATGNA